MSPTTEVPFSHVQSYWEDFFSVRYVCDSEELCKKISALSTFDGVIKSIFFTATVFMVNERCYAE